VPCQLGMTVKELAQCGVAAVGIQSTPRVSTPGGDAWAAKDRRKAARLIVEIRKCLAARGIRSVHDPRIDASLRQVWLRLLAGTAVQGLLLEEVGRQWECVR
jgi:hypothetical protein